MGIQFSEGNKTEEKSVFAARPGWKLVVMLGHSNSDTYTTNPPSTP